MIYNAKIKTIIPLLNLPESRANGLERLIEDLENNSNKIELPIKHFGNAKLTFDFTDKISRNDFDDKKSYELYLTIDSELDLDLFKIAGDAKMESKGDGDIPIELYDKIKETIPDFSPKWNDFPQVFMVPVAYKLFHNTYLKHFLRLTQIAHPGTLWIDDANVYMNDSQIEGIKGFTSILFEYDFKSKNWPPMIDLSVSQVWDYIVKRTTILDEFSKNEIERALNAFSYIFSRHYIDNVPVSLFWTISGLEALYVKGEVGITQQLNEKIQVFLGDIKADKKRLKRLYNYRSSLIHGGLNVPINDSIFEDEKYHIELYDMNAFGAAVLVASLQKIISKDMTELNFRYEYE
jgi:hypothetical protein